MAVTAGALSKTLVSSTSALLTSAAATGGTRWRVTDAGFAALGKPKPKTGAVPAGANGRKRKAGAGGGEEG